MKTSKTAGTSLEIALSKFCDPNDIITPISEEDESLRKDLGYTSPQNYKFDLSEYNLSDYFNLLVKFRKRRKKEFYNHITSKEVKHLVDNNCWNNYYKFCFERNPWDKVVSQYYWKTKDPRPPMKEFLKTRHLKGLKKRGYNIYTIDNEISVDKIYKFEDLKESLIHLQKNYHYLKKLFYQEQNQNIALIKDILRKCLMMKKKLTIQNEFSDEIKLFNYSFKK